MESPIRPSLTVNILEKLASKFVFQMYLWKKKEFFFLRQIYFGLKF